MQAHLHLCFSKRSCLIQAWWKLLVSVILLAFLTSVLALTPQAVMTWGSRSHQVSMCDGIVVLHHWSQVDLMDHNGPSLRSKIPWVRDHVFCLTGELLCRELSSEDRDFIMNDEVWASDRDGLFVSHVMTFVAQSAVAKGHHHQDSLLEQCSTVCLWI